MTSALYTSVFSKVVAGIQTAAYLKTTPITAQTRFEEDLGLDSIDVTEMLFHIEEIFNTEFLPDSITSFRCVSDVVSYLSSRFFQDVTEFEAASA